MKVQEGFKKLKLNVDFIDFTRDFLLTLFINVKDSYLGDDVTTNDDYYTHFKWCLNKTVEHYESEGIKFKMNEIDRLTIYEIFMYFYNNKKNDKNNRKFFTHIVESFVYSPTMDISSFDNLSKVYLRLNCAINY